MKNLKQYKWIILFMAIILYAHKLLAYDGSGSIISGGITRNFIFHAPGTSVAANLPMMLVFHGDGGNGLSIRATTGFDASADANNFIAVYPDAINTSWNRYVDNVPGDAGLGNPNTPDDVQFVSDLIDYFCSTFAINSNKVYATGHSAGGFMSYCLAVQLTNKIAAFAPVSASLWGDNTYLTNYFTNAYSPVPIYHIHGDADGIVNYPDPDFMPGAWGEWPLDNFSYGNCGNSTYLLPITNIVPGVNRLNFCSSAKEVYLIQINGMGHVWPTVAGYNVDNAIWNFCNAYALNPGTTCETGIIEINPAVDFSVYPNPAEGTFAIESNYKLATVKLFDVMGNEILLKQKEAASYSYSEANEGIYIVRITTSNGGQGVKLVFVR